MNTPSNSPTPVGGPPVDACPDTQELSALLDEQPTPGAEHGPLTQHIENCPACQRRLDELAGRGAWLDSLSTLGVSPTSAGRPDQREPSLRAVMDDLHRQPHASSPRGADSDLAFLAPADAPGYVGRLGPYEVIDVVGRGGMGIVLKAHDPALGRTVAIKVMAPVLAASQTARKRFVREARAAAAISHENVVTIHAVDEAQGLPYLVMQFVAGQSLEARIRESGGPLPVDEAVRLGAQTASGLAAAHAHGVIHRDVKPANIMLESGTGRVKLTDFGLAHAADEASVTVTGQVSGTPSFMAPEQARGERVDARADLFSLGCVLYAACAGRAPFNAPTPLAALRAVCDDEPPPLSGVNPDVPPWLAGLVHALLRKDPTQRPSTAREVADELASHLGDSASPGPRTGHAVPSPRMLAAVVAAPRRRRKRVTAVVAASLLLIAGMLALAEMSGVTRLTGRFRDRSAGSDAVADPAALAGPGEVAGGPVAVIPQDVAGRVRTFASLADAVSAAVSGETIELRHDDRVPAARVDIGRKALRIRAGDGFRPTLAPAGDGQAILTSGGAFVLEGITFEGTAGADAPVARGDDPGECLVVITGGGPVYVANCRFVVRGSLEARLGCLRVAASPTCEIRNTEVHALQAMGVQWIDLSPEGATLRLDNVIQSGRLALLVGKPSPGRAELTIDGSSFLAQSFVGLFPAIPPPTGLSVHVERSVVMTANVRSDLAQDGKGDRFEHVGWTDRQVIYDLMRRAGPPGGPQPSSGDDAPGEGLPRAVEAQVRFAGEFRRMQGLEDVPDPADFALEAIRMPGGRMAHRRVLANTGANIDLVGPGPAYEAFRQSSAYAAWRVRTDEALRQPR